jgi:hypothetical protein
MQKTTEHIKSPIFLVGVGRSGSTLFHHMLTAHPHAAWLSPLCELFPRRPALNGYLMNIIDAPLLRRWIHAGEFYKCWEHVYPGFSAPCRDLEARDLTLRQQKALREMAQALVGRRRDRLVVKLTGWSRMGLLRAAFPAAKFIHVLRDGRAVANSLLHVSFWEGRHGPEKWRWGRLPPDLAEEWQQADRSFVALAALQWRMLVEAVEQAAQEIPPADYLRLRYEDLCADPVGVFRAVVDLCDLTWTEGFERYVASQTLVNANTKWQRDLTAPQQKILVEVLADTLKRFGYAGS